MANTYYVDAQRPNDDGDGLSEGAAWKTIAKVNDQSFDPGDSILFKRGETWDLPGTSDEMLQPLTDGTSGNQITFGAYGEGALPIITARGDVPGWSTGGNWTNVVAEKLVDGGMEDWATATNLTSWVETLSGTSTINRDEDEHAGTYDCRFDIDGDGAYVKLEQEFELVASTTYTLSIYHKETGSASSDVQFVCLEAGDFQNFYLKSNGEPYTTWSAGGYRFPMGHQANYTEYTFTFTTPNQAGTYRIDLYRNGTDDENESMHLDAASVTAGSNVWYIGSITKDPSRVFIDDTEYVEAENQAGIDSTYRWWYDSGNDVLYVYATSNPAVAYSDMDGSYVDMLRAVQLHKDDYITLENLDLRGGYQCVSVSDSDYLVIDSCNIGKYSDTGISVYGDSSSPYSPSTQGEIKDCTFDADFSNTDSDHISAVSDGILLGNGVTYFKVHDNTLINWNHTGISLGNTSANNNVQYNEIYDNDISAPDTNYCRGIGCEAESAGDGDCSFNEMYRNYIHDTSVACNVRSDNNEFYYNIIDTVAAAPNYGAGELDCSGLDLIPFFSMKGHDNKIYNNVIYNVEAHGIHMYGDTGYGDTEDNLIRNNIIMDWGAGRYAISIEDDARIKGNTFQNNCFYTSGVSDVVSYRGTLRTIAEFNGENGNNSDVMGNNISVDPNFINAASANFRLLMGSVLRNAGTDVSLLIDYLGLLIRHAPDIGAYENQTNALF